MSEDVKYYLYEKPQSFPGNKVAKGWICVSRNLDAIKEDQQQMGGYLYKVIGGKGGNTIYEIKKVSEG